MCDLINKFDLFIFDLNNAIIDLESYHYEAWLLTLQNILGSNFTMSFDYFCEKFHSKDVENSKNYLVNILNLNDYETILINKNKNFINLINSNINNIKLIEGFDYFINLILKNNKKFIIISDSPKENIDVLIELFPILNKSFHFYHRDLFENKKLNKDCYLKIINIYPYERKICFTYNILVIHSLYNIKELTTVFVSNLKYIHYNYVLNNYEDVICVNNYNQLNQHYIENKVINTLRVLSVDMIGNAKSGHPGMPLGCAPMMYVLWCKIMNFNPSNPDWNKRDRFVLSNGHGCALLYSILYLLDYNYTLDDLKNFRQLHSKTPGHPEYNPLLGIEVSTGPLGQGIANGVGMAISSKKLGLDNNIYVMCGDGCLMEGISYEACSLAGHLELNNLIILYDDNGITIDGTTDITFTENTKKRFKAQNWNVLEVINGNKNIDDIYKKLTIAKQSLNKPTIIFVKTTIGYGSSKSGTSSVHGAPLGIEDTKELKKYMGFDENKSFFIDDDVKTYFKNLIKDKEINYNNHNHIHNLNSNLNNERTNINDYEIVLKELDNIKNGNKEYATRDLSNFCLNTLASNINNIIVGSADLAESNKTMIKSNYIIQNDFSGKYLHYGIREHSMTAIANGISTLGILPIVSTFLIFINYCLCGIRMSALSKHKVIYVFTHDSVLLGEDGPTHQPVESLLILRSIPNLLVIRPCDANETSGAYKIALKNEGPIALIMSRQVLPNIENSSNEKINKGAYVVYENYDKNKNKITNTDLIIICTGSEVSLSLEVANLYKNIKNIKVVSMPCCELFDIQDLEYKREILPQDIKKISIELGCTLGWYKYADYTYGIDTFGESGKIDDLKKYFKFNALDIKKYIDCIL